MPSDTGNFYQRAKDQGENTHRDDSQPGCWHVLYRNSRVSCQTALALPPPPFNPLLLLSRFPKQGRKHQPLVAALKEMSEMDVVCHLVSAKKSSAASPASRLQILSQICTARSPWTSPTQISILLRIYLDAAALIISVLGNPQQSRKYSWSHLA